MGTGLELVGNNTTKGIIPRAVEHLFNGISQRQEDSRCKNQQIPEFQVTAQFLEFYNKDVIDLLSQNKASNEQIKIREDKSGSVYFVGATTHQVRSVEETAQKLKMGALNRTTGATQVNPQSSRSHAIFTLHVKQTRVVAVEEGSSEQEFETLTAKFHFVDLAGSERLKRTGATGDRAKEGIAINSGLLVLGNVISALGDKTKRSQHVPYRDSKLTRFLQDSLGGNSRTLMIACISPSDRDFVETLNTLRYANRAKNITNRIQVNQDKSSQVISELRRQIAQLEVELMEYKQGKRLITEDGSEAVNDMYHENSALQVEVDQLKSQAKVMEEQISQRDKTVEQLKTQMAEVKAKPDDALEKLSLSSGTDLLQDQIKKTKAVQTEGEFTQEYHVKKLEWDNIHLKEMLEEEKKKATVQQATNDMLFSKNSALNDKIRGLVQEEEFLKDKVVALEKQVISLKGHNRET